MKKDTILFILSEIAKEMQNADIERQLYLLERREINLKKLNDMEKCDYCGETITGTSYHVYDENYNKQDGLLQCENCFSPEVDHDFHCFKCGAQLVETSLGLLWCKSCKKHLLPFTDKEGLQCLSIQNKE